MVTVRPGQSTPADLIYWTFIQTGRRSDPGFESVLTLLNYVQMKFISSSSRIFEQPQCHFRQLSLCMISVRE